MIDELDQIIRREMERERVPGLAIALVKDGEIVHHAGYGCADLESGAPVTPETVFGAASITKPVVATALMQLFEQGRFDLDDPIDLYLAPIRFKNPFAKPVTIRGLLTHTAGLPVGNTPAAPEATTLREQVAAGARVVRCPGEEIVYANWGYDTLGYLLGVLSGRPWHQQLREALLEPLGMSASAIAAVPEVLGYYLSRLDQEHHALPQPVGAIEPPTAAGSMISSVDDLARFLLLHTGDGHCAGVRILEPETITLMHRLHAASGGSPSGMGLGFRVDRREGQRLICHGGDGFGTTNLIAACPGRRIGVALLMNLRGAQATRSTVASHALRLLGGKPAAPAAKPASSEVPDGLCGRYGSGFWGLEADLFESEGALCLNLVRGDILQSRGVLSRLEPVSPGVWLARSGMFDGFELCFEHGPDGVRFHGGVYPFSFERTGDVPPAGERIVDEQARLVGAWQGSCHSPLGLLPMGLEILDGRSARVTFLTAKEDPVETLCAQEGRVEGEFELEVEGFGRFTVFLRLFASDGALVGASFARGEFGEFEMPTDLSPA